MNWHDRRLRAIAETGDAAKAEALGALPAPPVLDAEQHVRLALIKAHLAAGISDWSRIDPLTIERMTRCVLRGLRDD